MRKSVSYSYSFGNTCDKCGNEFERVTIKEQKDKGSKIEDKTNNIPYCRNCRVIKHGLGEDLDTVKESNTRSPYADWVKFIPAFAGIGSFIVYNNYISTTENEDYVGYAVFIVAAILAQIILSRLGLIKKTVDREDMGSYFLEDYDVAESNEEIIEKIKSKVDGHIEYSHNSHFERYDLFETYLKYQDQHERVFYIIESENVSEDNRLILEYTKNRLASPYIHILYFDNFNNKVYYKSPESDYEVFEVLDQILAGVEEE